MNNKNNNVKIFILVQLVSSLFMIPWVYVFSGKNFSFFKYAVNNKTLFIYVLLGFTCLIVGMSISFISKVLLYKERKEISSKIVIMYFSVLLITPVIVSAISLAILQNINSKILKRHTEVNTLRNMEQRFIEESRINPLVESVEVQSNISNDTLQDAVSLGEENAKEAVSNFLDAILRNDLNKAKTYLDSEFADKIDLSNFINPKKVYSYKIERIAKVDRITENSCIGSNSHYFVIISLYSKYKEKLLGNYSNFYCLKLTNNKLLINYISSPIFSKNEIPPTPENVYQIDFDVDFSVVKKSLDEFYFIEHFIEKLTGIKKYFYSTSFDTILNVSYQPAESTLSKARYFLILNNGSDTLNLEKQYKYGGMNATISKADPKVLPYIVDAKYCELDSDCSVTGRFCNTGVYNSYSSVLLNFSCTLIQYEDENPLELEKMCPAPKQFLEVKYSDTKCISNKCVAQKREVICKE